MLYFNEESNQERKNIQGKIVSIRINHKNYAIKKSTYKSTDRTKKDFD